MHGVYFNSGSCEICGERAWKECYECTESFRGHYRGTCGAMYFCEKCAQLAHGKAAKRNGHRVQDNIAADPGCVTELDLLSVICCEYNHYTCFTRSEDRWVFFDSMASRASKSQIRNASLGGYFLFKMGPMSCHNNCCRYVQHSQGSGLH